MPILFCSGQSTVLVGKVVDDQVGNPLAFSTIAIRSSNDGCISNQDGQFKINAEVGDTLEIRHTGFVSKSYAVVDFQDGFIEIRLKPAISQLNEFNVVEADERALKYIELAKKQLLKSGFIRSKAFLELFTEKDSLPTELLTKLALRNNDMPKSC